jgi:hydrogenase-4 component F
VIALACAVVPLVGVALLLALPGRRVRLAGGVLLAAAAAVSGLAVAAAAGRPPGGGVPLLDGYFVLDATAAVFLVLVSIVFLGVTLYVHYRLSTGLRVDGYERFVVRALLFLSSSVAAVLSNHLVAQWACLEAGTLAIAPLLFFARGEEAVRASWKYLVFSVVGLGLNFVGLMLLARGMGGPHGDHPVSFFLHELRQVPSLGEPVWCELGLALMVFGLGTKLGLAPMYAWLPDAYDEAPPAVTTLLAGVQFNCVMVALFRQVGLLRAFDPTLVSGELIAMGVLSVGVATLHLIRTKNYKRLVAYASINHAGTIAIGLGVGEAAAYGVVLYVVSNALVKAVLFLTCGNIKARFGTKQVGDLHGLIRVMPVSGWAFMLGAFALLGFAPFGSFLGEVIILSALAHGPRLALFLFLGVTLTLVLLATGRALFPMIWGDTPTEVPRVREPAWSIAPAILYVGVLVSLGIYTPAPVADALREVAAAIAGPASDAARQTGGE